MNRQQLDKASRIAQLVGEINHPASNLYERADAVGKLEIEMNGCTTALPEFYWSGWCRPLSTSLQPEKIKCIKALRSFTSLGLAESKNQAEGLLMISLPTELHAELLSQYLHKFGYSLSR